VRSLITADGVSLYLGGPCRVYGEASMERPCAIVEIALIPSLRITGMAGFVATGSQGGAEVMELALGWAGVEDLLCGPGFVEPAGADEDVTETAEENDRGADADGIGEVEEVRDGGFQGYTCRRFEGIDAGGEYTYRGFGGAASSTSTSATTEASDSKASTQEACKYRGFVFQTLCCV
jgi:hypothetical protein